MNRLTLLLFLACSALGCSAPHRPNILFIMADDLGKEWLSCYGSECHQTPNLDRLATGGIRFENVYATPLCTPTRHLLLTGRYPFRTGWTKHHDAPRWGGQYFDWNREITFARVLRSAGYATAIAGKWQINDLRTHPRALQRHGFDEHCVWTGFETGNRPSAERYFDPFIQHNGKRGTHKGAFGPDVFADFLIDFMARHKDRPFLAYYPMVLPHTPFTKTPHNTETTAKEFELAPGMFDYVDYQVGRLIETLDELNIRDRTIVFFTTDNGTVKGVQGRARGRLVDGGKMTLTEAGICVPFIVNGPQRLPAGRVCDELIDFSDIFPTLIDLAGAELPRGTALDGRSFADVLQGRAPGPPGRQWIFSQLGQDRVARDKRFKLYSDGRFYDIAADFLEQHDLRDSNEAHIATARTRLTAILKSLPPDAKLPFKRGPHQPKNK